MKPLKHDELLRKFWEGETSLDEEAILKYELGIEKDIDLDAGYFYYLNTQPLAPDKLEEEIWNQLPKKQSRIYKASFRWTAAASVILLCSIAGILGYQQRQDKLENDFALLEQTLHHVSKQVSAHTDNEVLYEDDVIVIVANN